MNKKLFLIKNFISATIVLIGLRMINTLNFDDGNSYGYLLIYSIIVFMALGFNRFIFNKFQKNK